MKRMKKIIAMLLVTALVGMSAGCGAKASAEPEAVPAAEETAAEETTEETVALDSAAKDLSGKKVALILFGTTFDFFVYIGAKANQVAEANGVQLDIMSTNDVAQGADLITQAVTSKYDAIISIGTQAFVSSYQEVNAAGIPLITYDSFVDGMETYARVGSNNYDLGVLAGEYAAEYLNGKEADGEVLVLNCPSLETMNERSRGFMDALAERAPEVEVEEIKLGGTEIYAEASQSYVDNLLISKPKGTVDLVFGSNAGMSLGAMAAVEVAGRDEIGVVGIDNEEGQLTALKDGRIYQATVAQDPVRIGEECMLAAIKALQGEKAGDVVIPGVVITQDNVTEYLENQNTEYAELEKYKP